MFCTSSAQEKMLEEILDKHPSVDPYLASLLVWQYHYDKKRFSEIVLEMENETYVDVKDVDYKKILEEREKLKIEK